MGKRLGRLPFHSTVSGRVRGIFHQAEGSAKLLSPNPPMDGVRTLPGGEEVTDAMVRARIREDEGLAAVCRRFWGCRCRLTVAVVSEMAGRGHGKRHSRAGLAQVCGDVSLRGRWGTGGRAPSGREWNGSQPGQGATELGFPRPALWQMQGEAACRAGEPPGQGKEPPPEGLGGHYLLAQAEPRRPAGEVMRHHLGGQPGGVGGEAPRRHVFSPTPYLRSRMAFSISAWRR